MFRCRCRCRSESLVECTTSVHSFDGLKRNCSNKFISHFNLLIIFHSPRTEVGWMCSTWKRFSSLLHVLFLSRTATEKGSVISFIDFLHSLRSKLAFLSDFRRKMIRTETPRKYSHYVLNANQFTKASRTERTESLELKSMRIKFSVSQDESWEWSFSSGWRKRPIARKLTVASLLFRPFSLAHRFNFHIKISLFISLEHIFAGIILRQRRRESSREIFKVCEVIKILQVGKFLLLAFHASIGGFRRCFLITSDAWATRVELNLSLMGLYKI